MNGQHKLQGKVALVTGATRGAGRAIALELALAGAKVYVTGRTTRESASVMQRPETIEETAELITAQGGQAIALKVDHTKQEEVAALAARIGTDNHGQLDILVNDAFGGDPFTQWGRKFWEHDLDQGLTLLRNAVDNHIITSWYCVPLMVARNSGVIFEITDGITHDYRTSLFYDLAKVSVNRLALAQAYDLKQYNVAVLAVSPGFLRSEAMLDRLGVTEANWREAIKQDPHFVVSETPYYLGRAIVALAGDPAIMNKSGRAVATWNLWKEYGFTDLDGTQPDWGGYAKATLGLEMG